jgi:hypothetical protein
LVNTACLPLSKAALTWSMAGWPVCTSVQLISTTVSALLSRMVRRLSQPLNSARLGCLEA